MATTSQLNFTLILNFLAECGSASEMMSGMEAFAIASNALNTNYKIQNMSTILEEIESKIEELKTSTTKSNVGVVRETGDGVARIEGLSDVMLNEMIEFPNGVYGLALNLEETEVGAILLGETTKVSEGDEAKTTGKLLQVPVGKAMLGRVVNTLGQPLDGKGPIKSDAFYPLEKMRRS